MAISCVYCGGSHERADDVRACWARTNGAAARPPAEPVARVAPVADASSRPVAPRPVPTGRASGPAGEHDERAAVAWAGPDALGRFLVVPAEVADAPLPLPWRAAPVVTVDRAALADPRATISRLRAAHQARERVVVRVEASTDPRDEVDERPLHQVGALGELTLEVLHHLVWSHAAVLAPGGRATYPPATGAIRRGAQPLGDGEPGDVRLPDGTAAWLDAGPLRWSPPIDGLPVVPAVAVEHGSLRPYGTNVSDADLAPDQLAAVTHPGGAARIIAPAGSGKTRVLTERARHLVHRWGLPPSALTLVAYNRRAQVEMERRLADVPGVQVRTLNSIALAVLNGNRPFAPQPLHRTTLTELEVRRVLGDFVQAPRRRSVDPLAPWLAAMSMARLGLRAADEVERAYDGDVDGLSVVLPQYEDALGRSGAVDFDGQITGAIRLLLTDPPARAVAQGACRVVLADEFQDMTPAHVLLLRLLAGPAGQVFGVGDDDQTIYGYNGADPRWLIDYESLFPGAASHPLEVNYRCPADVVEQVDRMLRRNLRRVPKTIRSPRAGTRGVRIRVGEDDPVGATVQVVREQLAADGVTREIAVLARVNAVLVPVQVALVVAGVPVQKVVGPEFLERASIRSALAWLRLACGSPDALEGRDLAEAVRRPSRSLSPRVMSWVAEQRSIAGIVRLGERLDSPRDAERVQEVAADLVRMRDVVRSGTTARAVEVLCADIGLAGTLATLDLNRRGMNAPSQSDDLTALAHLAALEPDVETFTSWLPDVLRRRGSEDGVTLATVHRVKGQEWPHVVVHLADAEQFPHRLAEDVSEERRLFHVALTRTSGDVTVVSGRSPSPFIAELTNEPTADELRPPAASPPPASTGRPRSGSVAPAPSAARDAPAKGPLTSGAVVAAVGLVLIDQGHEWEVVELGEEDVSARRGEVLRRFRFGHKVATAGRQRGPLAAPPDDVSPPSPAAFDRLRQLRDAVRAGKPAYTVFDDATLERIALALPRTLEALARVRGVGPAKLEQYGDQVVGLIDELAG